MEELEIYQMIINPLNVYRQFQDSKLLNNQMDQLMIKDYVWAAQSQFFTHLKMDHAIIHMKMFT